MYKKYVDNDYTQQFDPKEIPFVTTPINHFKVGSIIDEEDDNFTTSHYSEKIFPKSRVVEKKNSIVTEENIRTESSTDVNFKKIFEHCNVEWL